MEQFYEMRELYDWKKGNAKGKKAREGIRRALVLQFNKYFGADVRSLNSWAQLCAVIGGIEPIPQTAEECIEVSFSYL